jgi:Protein of unknown function DUF262
MPSFANIKKLISDGGYAADVPLGYLKQWMEHEREEIDLDPDFQRGHVWTKARQIRYMEFIIRGGQSSRSLYWNHPFYTRRKAAECNLPGKLLLVDGKQRLNACIEFLNNQVSVFGHYLREYDDAWRVLSASGPALRMHINQLQTRADVLQWYLDLNDGGTIHTTEEINRIRELLLSEPTTPPLPLIQE